MNKEFRKRLFELFEQMEELQGQARGIELEKNTEDVCQTKQHCECAEGPNHDTGKRYSSEFKKMIVRLHKEEHRTYESLTNQFGVSKATITKWCSDVRYENMAKLSATEKELRSMKADYEKIKEENAFLKQIVVMTFGKEMRVQS